VLSQYFEGLYYERYPRRNITIGITVLLCVGRERERERKKKNNKTDILRVRSKRKKKLLLKKVFVREDYSIYSRRLFFPVYTKAVKSLVIFTKASHI
jgi:hypothetical protein